MFSPILLTIGDNIDKVFYAFDLWVFRFFGSMQCGFLTGVAKFFTAFGDENFTIPIVVLIILKYSLTIEGSSDGDPMEVLVHDKVLMGLCLVYFAAIFAVLYL